jgi:hypothetical protein
MKNYVINKESPLTCTRLCIFRKLVQTTKHPCLSRKKKESTSRKNGSYSFSPSPPPPPHRGTSLSMWLLTTPPPPPALHPDYLFPGKAALPAKSSAILWWDLEEATEASPVLPGYKALYNVHIIRAVYCIAFYNTVVRLPRSKVGPRLACILYNTDCL